MKIATWNVNSVRARLDSLSSWLRVTEPDVVLLQEIKCVDAAFPYGFFEDLGYSCGVFGQKTYNGVAVVSKVSLEDAVMGLPTFPEDPAARYLEVVVAGKVRVASLYIPNGGQEVGGESYQYKLVFLERLREHLATIARFDEIILIGGDYNIAPDDGDVYDEKIWHDRVCCTDKERNAFQALRACGYNDLLDQSWREKNPDSLRKPFTWWDYRTRDSFTKNRGLRLDHFLGNQHAQDALQKIYIDAKVRTQPRPSDHAPVICELK